jgi:hypothetical protein
MLTPLTTVDPLDSIARLIPSSHWLTARLTPSGDPIALKASDGDQAHLLEFARDEIKRQRVETATGPRIAATLSSLRGCESGITLLFADSQTTFGLLILLRTWAIGLFTSSEVRVLTIALNAISNQLTTSRQQPGTQLGSPAGKPLR